MKKIIIPLLVLLLSCKKESTCGTVVGSRACAVCANQPSFIIDISINGQITGFESRVDYAKGEKFCK